MQSIILSWSESTSSPPSGQFVIGLVDVLDDVDVVEVVEVDDHVEDDVVLANVLNTVEVLVVVVSHPLQVLAQCVIFATLLSHKPCN